MRLSADMGVSLPVVSWLRGQRHDVLHLRGEGLQRLSNGEIFVKASNENGVILTFDLDFGEIAALSKGGNASVIVFRLRNSCAAHVIDRLTTVLAEAADVLGRGAVVVVVEEWRYRIRHLPIGSDGADDYEALQK